MNERKEVIMIAAGGTGGHIFPAVSLARELKKRNEGRRIIFMGTKRGLERKIIPAEGFELIELNAGGVKGKGMIDKVSAMLKALLSFFWCMGYIARVKPSIVIGAGSYVSGPVVSAAWLLGLPTMIQEQNLYPGITNRLLSRIARGCAVSFEDSKRYLHGKVVFTGNPVREDFTHLKKKERGGKLSVLIFGGSLGARTINRGMMEALPLIKIHKERLSITHQTGSADFEMVKESYRKEGIEAEVLEFINDMPKRFESADIIISRAGASTIAEIIAAGKASILVPLPSAANDHQRKNAEALSRVSAALSCEDSRFSGRYVAETMRSFLDDPSRIDEMEKHAASLYSAGAAGKIADMAERLMVKR